MNAYKIGYVVLHYQAINETVNCINSIKNIRNNNDVIIVIDNSSPNGSGRTLQSKFQDEMNIRVIINPINYGFAKGNNVGYAIAKQEYNCDFIVMLNNDTLIVQLDFRDKIIEAYQKYHFAVMGPKILQKDGSVNILNPSIPVHVNLRKARIGQISNYIRYYLSFWGLDIWFGKLVDRKNKTSSLFEEVQENVQLSGCCWIFSKDYISQFDGINPDTFMYLEEILLYLRVKTAGLRIIYNPDMEIIHLEDMATLEAFKGKTRKARRFKYFCQIQSFRVLIKQLLS